MNMLELADYLREVGVLKTKRIHDAFKSIDRQKFMPSSIKSLAYVDEAMPIGHGQTISQPYTVAFMLEKLSPGRGQKILDVGSGSGWTTALLAHIVGPKGKIIGIERIPELVQFGKKNIAKFDLPWAEIRQAKSGVFGAPAEAPFDRILVSAGISEIPKELVAQLAKPGVMVIPIKDSIIKLSKDSSGQVKQEVTEGFIFVPLIRK